MKMKFTVKLITALTLAFILFCGQMILSPQEAAAAQPSVILNKVKGDVFVKKGGGLRELPAENGMELVQGDWLRTGKNGTVKLSYEDGTEATVGSNSSLNIQRLTRNSSMDVSGLSGARVTFSQDGQQSSVQLQSGSIWSKVKSLFNMDDSYEVETPTAVMGVRGTLYLVSVNPADGSTQGDVIEGIVGAAQNNEAGLAAPIQLVTMGQTLRLVSLEGPLPEHRVIDPQELIGSTEPEILVQLVNDIMERSKELANLTNEQQQAYGETGIVDHLTAAIGTSYKLDELVSFGKEFMTNLQKSDKLEEVSRVLSENNQSLNQLRSTMDTLKKETQEIRSDVLEAAQKAGVSQDRIKDIENQAVGVPTSAAASSGQTSPNTQSPTTGSNTEGGSSSGNGSSGDTTVLSSEYIVSAGTISNVSYGTSLTDFLSKVQKGESHQTWNTSGLHDPVQNNDRIIVTAQNGTEAIYIISVASAPASSLGTFVPIYQGVPISFTNGVKLDFGNLTISAGAEIKAVDITSSLASGDIPVGMTLASRAIDFTTRGMGEEETPASLSIPLNPGADPAKVGVYYFDEQLSEWKYQASSVLDGKVIAKVNHFSTYAVMSSDEQVNLVAISLSPERNQLKLTFDRELYNGSLPAVTDFAVKLNNSLLNVVSVGIDTDSHALNLNLDKAICLNDRVRISYNVGSHHIRDIDGNSLRSFADAPFKTYYLPGPSAVLKNPGTKTVQEITVGFYEGQLSKETLSLNQVNQVIEGSSIILRRQEDNLESPISLTISEVKWEVEDEDPEIQYGHNLVLTLVNPYTFSAGDTIDVFFVRGAVMDIDGESAGAAETELVVPSPPDFTVNRSTDNRVFVNVQGIPGVVAGLYHKWEDILLETLTLDDYGYGRFEAASDGEYYLVQSVSEEHKGMQSQSFFAGPSLRVISGVISLPNAEDRALTDIHVKVNAYESNHYSAWVSVIIPKGENSKSYQLYVPYNQEASGYCVQLNLKTQAEYLQTAWYESEGVMTPYSDQAGLIDVYSSDWMDLNLSLLSGVQITGTVALPSGTAETDIPVTVCAAGTKYPSAKSKVVIKKGLSSAEYSLTVPVDGSPEEGYKVSYDLGSLNSLEEYFASGWYAGPDQEAAFDRESAEKVYVDSQGVSGIDLIFCRINMNVEEIIIDTDNQIVPINIGNDLTLSATVYYGAQFPNHDVTWHSSDISVATVSEYGQVQGQKAGVAIITATSAVDTTKSAFVKVAVQEVGVEPGIPVYQVIGTSVTVSGSPGAIIKLYDANNHELIISDVLNSDGTLTFENLPAGLYEMTETMNGLEGNPCTSLWIDQKYEITLALSLDILGNRTITSASIYESGYWLPTFELDDNSHYWIDVRNCEGDYTLSLEGISISDNLILIEAYGSFEESQKPYYLELYQGDPNDLENSLYIQEYTLFETEQYQLNALAVPQV